MASFDISGVLQSRVDAAKELYQGRLRETGTPDEKFSKILAERLGTPVTGRSVTESVIYSKVDLALLEPIRNIPLEPKITQTEQVESEMSARRAQYAPLVSQAASKYGLSEKLIHGVIQAESSYRPQIVSSAGAQGLMQLMPGTAKSLGVTDSFDPAQNIDGGTRYLQQMIERFDGDIRLALAAYNCGPNRVESLGVTDSNDSEQYGRLSTNVRAYVERVIKYASA